jgi:hypothetical protein
VAVVEIVVPVVVPVAVAAVLAASGGVAEMWYQKSASFPAYFSAAKTRLTSETVDNYYTFVRSEGALVFVVAVAVELGFEVASELVTEVEIGLGPEPEAMTADFATAEVVAVVSVAEAEAFG